MREHELRRQVIGEMHLRRWPVVTAPGLIIQFVLSVDDEERAKERELLDDTAGLDEEQTTGSHRSGELFPGIRLAWERHSEGSSVALFIDEPDIERFGRDFGEGRVSAALDWINRLPGKVIRATQILLVENDAIAESILPQLDFARGETVSCRLGGRTRMWADFRLKDDGFGKLLVAANGTHKRDVTRAIQRLQELGNYRNRALLGLPAAQNAWPRLDEAERHLSELARQMAASETRDDELMEMLSALSVELSTIATSINYRLSATAAYSQLVQERLSQLEVERIEGFASLADFTQRRFLPAVRTCASVTERERQLSARASDLASLLRARISTRIENQNAALLHSMERSTKMQLRLQQLVEGLSVVALSYYVIGLIAYLLKGGEHWWPHIDAILITGLLVPPVVLGMWLTVRLLKRRLLGHR